MCSILGFMVCTEKCPDPALLTKLYQRTMASAFSRGRDAGGYVAFHSDGSVLTHKSSHGSAQLIDCEGIEWNKVRVVLQNNRAEPTNEFKFQKTEADIMPFSYDRVHAVHNGTIANDAYIRGDEKWPTTVDSYAIPVAIRQGRFQELIGSMAVAWVDARAPIRTLHLYRNYQPLSVILIPYLGVRIFASLPEYITDAADELGLHWQPVPFPPYSEMRIRFSWDDRITGVRGEENSRVFQDNPTSRNAAVVVCSGGLDSTTAAAIACRNHEEVILAHFWYGCRAEARETKAVGDIADALQRQYPQKLIAPRFFDLSFLKTLGGSTIVDGQDQDIGGAIEGTELAIDWVPARNAAMLGLIASFCDRYDIPNIYLGLNLEESGAYCDNTIIFHRAFEEVLQLGTHVRPRIINPLDNCMKRDIVKLAMEVKAPLDLSWSCYRGGEKHCGRCGPCQMRQTAFLMNGIREVVDYENWLHPEIRP